MHLVVSFEASSSLPDDSSLPFIFGCEGELGEVRVARVLRSGRDEVTEEEEEFVFSDFVD